MRAAWLEIWRIIVKVLAGWKAYKVRSFASGSLKIRWILAPPIPESIALAEIGKSLEGDEWIDWICPADDILHGEDTLGILVFE